jgi:hypothetical protein
MPGSPLRDRVASVLIAVVLLLAGVSVAFVALALARATHRHLPWPFLALFASFSLVILGGSALAFWRAFRRRPGP